LPAEEAARGNGLSAALIPWKAAPLPAVQGRMSSASSTPNQELVPQATGFSLAQAPWAEGLLVPLVQQFTQMQQQMFDQFQQAMIMMVQTFRALHKDQVGLVRQELNQLRHLTQELRNLQAESAKLGGPAPATVASAATTLLPGVNNLALAHQETMIAALETCFSDAASATAATPAAGQKTTRPKPVRAAASVSEAALAAESSASSETP